MVYKDIETPMVSTGGVLTAMWNFLQTDEVHMALGVLVSLSVIALNIVKIYTNLKNKNNEDN
tara:strand:- start:26 stop:211 length:186 start_codon:yes stop_codon:yes gene_type:complete